MSHFVERAKEKFDLNLTAADCKEIVRITRVRRTKIGADKLMTFHEIEVGETSMIVVKSKANGRLITCYPISDWYNF